MKALELIRRRHAYYTKLINEAGIKSAQDFPDAILPISEYKDNYDIILNTVFSGEGGTITFCPNGDSDSYKVEGDQYLNIVGMKVVLPENGAVTAAEAAAEILFCAAPFGRYAVIDRGDLFEEHVADKYTLQAKRMDIKIALPYCRDKEIRRELKREMNSPYQDLCLSGEASEWFISGKGTLWGKLQNRSKRKRKYRMEKRIAELNQLSENHHNLEVLETKIGTVPESLAQVVLSSSSIVSISYESQTYGKSDRIDYLADLLLNPLYDSNKFLKPGINQECVCVLFISAEYPCTIS